MATPDLHKKWIAITGPTSGIGEAMAFALVGLGYHVVLLARNMEKAQLLAKSLQTAEPGIEVKAVHCDLENMSSVKAAAEEMGQLLEKLDVLVNNAGAFFPNRGETSDGLERTFAVNHFGHFYLTLLLLPLLEKSDDKAQVISVSSEAHKAAKLDFSDLQLTKAYRGITAYANAKLCNILFTKELDRLHGDKLRANTFHPGMVNTQFARHAEGPIKWLWKIMTPFMKSANRGAETGIWLVHNQEAKALHAEYCSKKKPFSPSGFALNKAYQQQLWEQSLDMLKPFDPTLVNNHLAN